LAVGYLLLVRVWAGIPRAGVEFRRALKMSAEKNCTHNEP